MPGRILIVDDVATNRIVLKVTLTAACYEVIQAQCGQEALNMAGADQPDLILLDLVMPDIDGIDVCARLKANPETANIPIIVVTSFNDDSARIRALEAGADDFMSKPLDEMTLLARVRSLMRSRDTDEELRLRETTCSEFGLAESGDDFTPPTRIALVATAKPDAIVWKSELSALIRDPVQILSMESALSIHEGDPVPDIFVISGDLRRPDEGLRLLSELRSRSATRYCGIIMVLRADARQQAVIALDLGANDLMTGSFDAQELALRIKAQARRKHQADKLRNKVRNGLRMAVMDPLTGLYNRRYAFSHLARIAERSGASKRPFAVMMLDIDRFKSVNDTWGHAAGDAVLTKVAHRLRDNLRGVDLVARIGGEEFLVVMPDTELFEAQFAAERLRRIVEDTAFPLPHSAGELSVTLSIGVSMSDNETDAAHSIDKIVDRADQALLSSKDEGRNQVTFSKSAA